MNLKIIVPVKRVVESSVRIRVKSDGSGVDTAHAKMAMNPFDEIALEEAIRLREKGVASEIVVVSIGPLAAQETLRSALALGADRGLLVLTDQAVEPLAVARLLAAIVTEEAAGLVLMGKLSIDEDNSQTGQMLAALLGWGQGTCASSVSVADGVARVVCETDVGLETLDVPLPAVITADLRLNQPRYASLPNIMQAKKKPIVQKTPSDFGVDIAPRLRIVGMSEPAARRSGTTVASVDDLLVRLRSAGLVAAAGDAS